MGRNGRVLVTNKPDNISTQACNEGTSKKKK